MVINSTNINKTNNHLSPQINTVNIKKTMTYDVGNPGPGLELAQKCGEVKFVNVCTLCDTDSDRNTIKISGQQFHNH
jgi:hypothetical protein